MPRGQSNRGGSRGGNSRGGSRQNVSLRRGFSAMDDETQRRISAKGGRALGEGGRRGRRGSEDSDRSE